MAVIHYKKLEVTLVENLNTWYNEQPGKTLLKMELAGLSAVLPQLFGYFFVQLGGEEFTEIKQYSPIHQKILISSNQQEQRPKNFIHADFEKLPLLPETIDVILAFHVLEFSKNPKMILQEIYQKLIPGGTALIFGFNPHSIMGVTKFLNKDNSAPWNGTFYNPLKMRKMLIEIGFTVGDYQTFYFRPFFKNKNTLKKFLFLESIGPFFWSYFGASYLFIAKKNLVASNVIVPELRHKKIQAAQTQVANYERN